jgi:hypothetical protein
MLSGIAIVAAVPGLVESMTARELEVLALLAAVAALRSRGCIRRYAPPRGLSTASPICSTTCATMPRLRPGTGG